MANDTMHNRLGGLYEGLQAIVNELAAEHNAAGTPKVVLSRPNEEKFGDFATNVALLLAPVVRSDPRSIATQVAERVGELPGVDKVEVAGPGFVNITLDDAWFLETINEVVAAGDRYGSGSVTTPEHILLEYVSANPTGPLVAASARHAAYGDSLARIMRFCGHEVSSEYYFNDTGRQVDLFGQSLKARIAGEPVPEGGYEGDYIIDLAHEIGATPDDAPQELGERGVACLLEHIRESLETFRVRFDRFQSERQLHDSKVIEEALKRVADVGQTYDADGATWLRTTAYGDDKDRVLVRSNGQPTYYAADVGYLLDKFNRGIDRAVTVLGADHHGYVARLQAATQALGKPADACEVVIMQMVHLLEGGEAKRMSKRRGDIVTMEELLDKVGVDAARFFLIQRSHDQTLELDMELAAEATAKNPVYYVQYAHARICSIMRKVESELGDDLPEPGAVAAGDSADALHPSERRLIKRIAEFPVTALEACERRHPHKMTVYAHELASDFSLFYRDCRVVGDGITPQVTAGRMQLCRASRQVLARCLDLVGVHAPDKM